MNEQQKENPEQTLLNNPSSSRDGLFQCLIHHVQSCRLCPRMEGRTRVLGLANGSLNATILFVAEAPGRLGADRSGMPLNGDQTGRNFDLLLQAAEIERSSTFITNAVLCNPRDEQGHNASPTPQEIAHCSNHLQTTITLLQPLYVITLGQIALRALQYVAKHEIALAQHVGCPQQWNGRWLIPFYHPGPRARLHRPFATQLEDFRCLGKFIKNDKAYSGPLADITSSSSS
jgi:uracil-DNA glycosylase